MSFIVQISPFVHQFTLKIVFRRGFNPPKHPQQGSALDLLRALSGPQTPRRKLCLHFILYLATPLLQDPEKTMDLSQVTDKLYHIMFVSRTPRHSRI